jgi:glucose-1-phosphate thymidylyltransferase
VKGLILAAGLGTRLRPITSLRPKPTIPIAGKALIQYAVDDLIDVGIRDIGIVVSHETINHLKETLSGYRDANYAFLLQDPPQGLAHAVAVSRDFLGDEPFVMYLGDNLFEQGIAPFVAAFDPGAGVNAVLALVRVEDPRAFGVAVVEAGRITELIEKPEHPPSNLAVAGVYVFDASIHRAIEGLKPGAKGEYQITDAIARLIGQGGTVVPVEVQGWWKDTGKAEDLLDANRLLLSERQRSVAGEIEESEIVGEVVVEPGAVVRRSKIFGPALIGAEARVIDAYVGPFTTLGPQVRVQRAEVEYSVIGAGSIIRDLSIRVHGSLIGEGVTVAGVAARPNAHRLVVGDMSRVEVQE